MAELDADAMTRFTDGFLVDFLTETCGVDRSQVEAICQDISDRAEAFAALDSKAQETLSAPFLEEVVSYKPAEARLILRAFVTVVVRNSELETVHANDGPLNLGGIEAITTYAAAPLSHLLKARQQTPISLRTPKQFADLPTLYPRAWAALAAITRSVETGGGRVSFRAPDAPIPDLPTADAAARVERASSDKRKVVQSAIDETLNIHLVKTIQMLITHGAPLYVPSLSRVSRNMDRLLYVIELLLAHDIPIVTTNYLIRSGDAWVRKGRLLPPDNYNDVEAGLNDLSGLSGSHRKMVEAIREAGLRNE